MGPNQKTPSQHNSTLFISPQIAREKQDVFITPPNPNTHLFDTPSSSSSSFYNRDNVSNHRPGDVPDHNPSEEPLSRAEKLRLWRHDAMMQHHYTTAEYIGDKILSLTNDPNDAFWLAQVHFNKGNYLRAYKLLSSKPEFESSLSCRYLSAYSLVKLERWDDALDLLGETNPFKDSTYKVRNTDGGTRLEASMCYLRGVVYANQSNLERAQEAYREAVMVDVKCFEAFNELISNNFLSPSEQWDFINQLNYADADDNDELIKLLYTCKLSKFMNNSKFEEAESVLKDEYRLGDNADLLVSRAEYLYVRCNYDECLKVCEQVLDNDPYNFSVLPHYLSCLYELGGRNKLFLKAHQLADNHPTNPLTWQAIGTYYLSINRTIDARKFFSKATMLNPNSGQCWVEFAHTFAFEGEHEQAISAYAFAARLCPGTHLPNLYLGMQHLQMKSINLAEEYLLASYEICNTDPLLLNELGVVHYHRNSLQRAELIFQEALGAAKYLNSDSKTWISIHSNLGHVYRKSHHPYKALDCFNQALKLSAQNDCNTLASMGLVYIELGDIHKAIQVLHDALAIEPSDGCAQDLLKKALSYNRDSNMFFHDMDARLTEILATYKPKFKKAFGSEGILQQNRKPVINDVKAVTSDLKEDADIDAMVEGLKRGEASSDEEVMDIESD